VTALTVSGFETYGDNQFATPITLFPDLRNQDKYQFRYDLSHVMGKHALKFGVDFIHEPVLGGAFASTAEQFILIRTIPRITLRILPSFILCRRIRRIHAIRCQTRLSTPELHAASRLPAMAASRRTCSGSDSTLRTHGASRTT